VVSHEAASWQPGSDRELYEKAKTVGVRSYSEDEDIRSLKSIILYGMKGIAAYAHHAAVLGHYSDDISSFLVKGLAAVAEGTDAGALTSMVLETGDTAVKTMKLLDEANTAAYGMPEKTEVSIGVRQNPGILISGHDLKDMEELLEQTKGTGIDVYTHCEMLPANYYPAFKKYEHFAGNYGGSWWHQRSEFEAFNGPILMTTNCIISVKDSYRDRIYTTGMAGYPGVEHIPDRPKGGAKDFTALIEKARTCPPPEELEKGSIVGGFAHNQIAELKDSIVEAVKSGKIKKFVVMAGCDGRQNSRKYYTDVAQALPGNAVILTAGCAKYRYNKLDLGDIEGIPRVIDAGQCNDSYSLAVTALALKDAFKVDDVNDLPVSFDIAWYEQKAVAVLLALLSLGFKNIILGPTLPAFLTENTANVLVDKFGLRKTGEVSRDVQDIMQEN
jgi:hydroxylamine reductase